MLTPLLFSLSLFGIAFPLPSQSQVPLLHSYTQAQARFPAHTLYELNDGTFLPSPAYGVGSEWKGINVTDNVLLALKTGWRHIDNAAFYRNEENVGTAIKASGLKREQVYITTKFDGLQGQDVELNLKASLEKLQTDYVDLYLLHFPFLVEDITKVWPQMESLRRRGLARSIGVSNYNVTDLTPLLKIASILPSVNQVRYHGYNHATQDETVDFGREYGIRWEAYSPLSPVTKYPGGPIDEVAARIAKRLSGEVGYEVNQGQVALAWLKAKGIVAVTTTDKEKRLRENLEVFSHNWPSLTEEEVKEYDEAGRKQNRD
ncbi:Aldo/keto reductase [Atractiella rhizophila]|nr:Aldo/keto reductase [Atractiella rhizophila]